MPDNDHHDGRTLPAMSFIGGLMEASPYWPVLGRDGHEGDFAALVDRAPNVLEHGLGKENP
ncbi:hypothetical protein L1856_29615 [Streptomyces sp. Tue 6430]|nr:hypothetical protein [Streptomyces sp. Tue 6430]